MKTAEKILKKKTVFREEMEKVLSEREYSAVWKDAAGRLDGFLRRYGSLPEGVHMHTDSRILPAAAIYLSLKDAVGQETAFRIVEDACVKVCEPIAEKLKRLMKVPWMRSLFIKIWDPMTRIVFGAGNGFTNVFYPRTKNEYRMDVTSCPYFRYFTELGCPELTRIFCENDDRIYGDLPGLEFTRTGTLGKGAERCDFRLRKL
ncbi:MAG: L-2-amino-thiazoline-4-carboxylic acid hydrolase [Eubacteriaceae bacterium]|nr:L-2-amino-thiazoline-4-carboxylic acid hydrolase [Eubacteriaceae bacterium]